MSPPSRKGAGKGLAGRCLSRLCSRRGRWGTALACCWARAVAPGDAELGQEAGHPVVAGSEPWRQAALARALRSTGLWKAAPA